MHATQATYALARASYETTSEACRAECVQLYVGLDDAEMDDPRLLAAFGRDAEIHAAHGWRAARDALRAAEDAMVEWSFAATEAAGFGTPAQHAEIRRAWERASSNLTHRARFVDLAFRLAPTPAKQRRAV